MNIALFSDSYLPTKSGIVTVVIQLRQILEQMGHHVVIVTVDAGPDGQVEDDPCVLRVPSLHSPVGDDQYMGFPRRRRVIEFLKKNNIQIIHSHTEFFLGHMANVAGKKLKIPVIATTHTMWEDYYKYYLMLGKLIPRKVIRKVVQRIYKKFYAFINVSQKAHDYFRKPFILPKIPSAIIPNAIDAKHFAGEKATEQQKKELKNSLGIGENQKVILYVGRIVSEKRLDDLLDVVIRTVNKRANTKMVFVGSGDREEALRNKVKELGLSDKIIFTGFIDWHKLYIYYNIADVFVTVSLSEMHSMTILEALSQGVPVVCRKDTSFSDTVFHGIDGFFALSDKEVDDYLIKILNDSELGAKMGKEAFEVSQRFTLDIHGRRTVAFYEEVLKHYPNPVTPEELQLAVDKIR